MTQKEVAIQCLKKLGIYKPYIRKFEEDGTVTLFEMVTHSLMYGIRPTKIVANLVLLPLNHLAAELQESVNNTK